MVFCNLLDGGQNCNRPLLGPSESVRGGTPGTNPRQLGVLAGGHGDSKAGAHPHTCFLMRPLHVNICNTPSHLFQGWTNNTAEPCSFRVVDFQRDTRVH
jgi:hypothetical protein